MKLQMSEIHVINDGRDAVLILRGKVPKRADYLKWYCSMLGRVMNREKGRSEKLRDKVGKEDRCEKTGNAQEIRTGCLNCRIVALYS